METKINNYRWFKASEIGVCPDAPKVGDLVWVYFGDTKEIVENPCRIDLCKATGELRAVLSVEFYGWLEDPDMVCRVMIPEEPKL